MTEAIQMEVNSIQENPFHAIEETGQVISQMTTIAGRSPDLILEAVWLSMVIDHLTSSRCLDTFGDIR